MSRGWAFKRAWAFLFASIWVFPVPASETGGDPGPSIADRVQVERIFAEKCGTCHRGPWLDLTKYPFYSDRSDDQRALMNWFMERIEMEGWKKMPPVNGTPLTAEELSILRRWNDSGLPDCADPIARISRNNTQ